MIHLNRAPRGHFERPLRLFYRFWLPLYGYLAPPRGLPWASPTPVYSVLLLETLKCVLFLVKWSPNCRSLGSWLIVGKVG